MSAKPYSVLVQGKDTKTGEKVAIPTVMVMRGGVKIAKMLGHDPERMKRWARQLAAVLNEQQVEFE